MNYDKENIDNSISSIVVDDDDYNEEFIINFVKSNYIISKNLISEIFKITESSSISFKEDENEDSDNSYSINMKKFNEILELTETLELKLKDLDIYNEKNPDQ